MGVQHTTTRSTSSQPGDVPGTLEGDMGAVRERTPPLLQIRLWVADAAGPGV